MTRGAPTLDLHAEAPAEDGRQWVHLLPAGRFTGLDGRGPYDATDIAGIIEASRRASGQRKMVIDYNHATDIVAPKGGEAPAAGWIEGLQARTDGVWGRVEWTPRAAQQIADREYRYISPVIRHQAGGQVDMLRRASLVNAPNLDQLTALNSAEEEAMDDNLQARLRELLGLGAEADAEAIVSAVSERVTSSHSATPDPSQYVPIGMFQRALAEGNKLRQGIALHAAQEHVDTLVRKGTVLPWMRDWSVELCMSNLPAFEKFTETIGTAFSRMLTPSGASVVPPKSSLHAENDPLTAEIAKAMGLDPKKLAEHRAASEPAANL
jgi:phage I-like protein